MKLYFLTFQLHFFLEKTARSQIVCNHFVFKGKHADVWSIAICCWAIVDRVYFLDEKSGKKLLGIYYREKPKSDAIPLGEAQVSHINFFCSKL